MVGNTYEWIFSNAKTPINQQIAKHGWKNNANLVAFLKFVKSCELLDDVELLCIERSAKDS
jgi:hypothetical protein